MVLVPFTAAVNLANNCSRVKSALHINDEAKSIAIQLETEVFHLLIFILLVVTEVKILHQYSKKSKYYSIRSDSRMSSVSCLVADFTRITHHYQSQGGVVRHVRYVYDEK